MSCAVYLRKRSTAVTGNARFDRNPASLCPETYYISHSSSPVLHLTILCLPTLFHARDINGCRDSSMSQAPPQKKCSISQQIHRPKSPSQPRQRPKFGIIGIPFRYTDNSSELCAGEILIVRSMQIPASYKSMDGVP